MSKIVMTTIEAQYVRRWQMYVGYTKEQCDTYFEDHVTIVEPLLPKPRGKSTIVNKQFIRKGE